MTGAAPWVFLDRCAGDGIVLTDVRSVDELTVTATVSERYVSAAERIAQRCGCRFEILYRRGAPLWRAAVRRYRFAAAGMALIFAALLASSLFVWEISVAENPSAVPDAEILRVLRDQGVGVGSFWPAFRGERIRTAALLELPELSFLTVNVRGSRAFVQVRPVHEPPEIFDPGRRADVTAARSGVIESVTALAGRPLIVRGGAVTEGETLIEGTPAEPHARGTVRAYTYYEFTAAAPLTSRRVTALGPSQRRFALILGTKRINIFADSGILPDDCGKMTKTYTLAGTGLPALPVRWVTETLQSVSAQTTALDGDAVRAALTETLHDYLCARLCGGEILGEYCSVSTDGEWMTVTLRAQCLERIDADTPRE